jgi:hypothetical protein
MATTSIGEQRVYGRMVLERLDGAQAPAALKGPIATFKKAHEAYEKAASRVEEERATRDAALDAVGDADDGFDASASELADKVIGAGLGKRKSPFAAFSKLSPSGLAALPYAEGPKAARGLVAALKKAGPPADVLKVAARLLKDADAVEAALGKLTKPQAAYAKSLADREALLPGWSKALRSLKRHAAAAWDEEEATFKAIFAPPGAVQAPKKARAKKKKAKGEAGQPA